jgi:mannose-6-phosphate isomerase-like protein (cupin superfamily)
MTDLRGYHLGPSEGKAWWFLDTLMIVKAGGQDAHDSFTFIEFRAPNGFAPPLHIHHREDEAFYMLEGSMRVVCGDEQWEADVGSFVMLPRGVPHAFVVTSESPCRGLQITSPAQFERFIEESGRPAQTLALPEPSPPDIEALTRSAERYGNEFVGPPLSVGDGAPGGR